VASNKIVSYDDNSDTSGANVLLSTCVDDSVLAPVNGPSHEVGGHIADENLTLRHLVKREVVKLDTLNSLVVAVVEKLGISSDVPVFMSRNGCVSSALVVGYFVSIAVFLSLRNGTFRPGTGGNKVGGLLFAIL